MRVRLVDFQMDDMPQVERWLRAEHVLRFWGDPEKNAREIRQADPDQFRALIELDGRKVGYVQWQRPTRTELDEAGLHDIPASVIDIDIMIGEVDAKGHGAASSAIREVVTNALSDPSVPFVIAATSVSNVASRRAFEKAGFRLDWEFDDPEGGPFLLMVRGRDG